MVMTSEIKLVQLPVIQHAVQEIGKSIDARLKELNIDGQIATIDTIKSLKDLRADFNKELKEYESQRTLIKKSILSPYDEFELEYKKGIKDKIEKAVETLKDKIATVEDDLRKSKKQGLEDYFNELKESKNIDFITFEQTGIEVTLSTPDKQYKEKCIEFINKVADDLELIETQDFRTEIFLEYKSSLNISNSIKTVKSRKETLKIIEEQEAKNQLDKRINILVELGFAFNENTANYEKEDSFISYETLKSESKEAFIQWTSKFIKSDLPESKEVIPSDFEDVVYMDIPKVKAPSIQSRKYTVSGTSTQFSNLDKFLKENNINFQSFII